MEECYSKLSKTDAILNVRDTTCCLTAVLEHIYRVDEDYMCNVSNSVDLFFNSELIKVALDLYRTLTIDREIMVVY